MLRYTQGIEFIIYVVKYHHIRRIPILKIKNEQILCGVVFLILAMQLLDRNIRPEY